MCSNGCSYEYDEQEEELTHTRILKPRSRKIARVCVGLNGVCAGCETHAYIEKSIVVVKLNDTCVHFNIATA